MTFTVGKVYTLKLNSGEEVVAKIESKDNFGIIQISNPLSVMPGQQGMGLVPSMFTAQPGKKVSINMTSIVMFAETEETVEKKYIQATTGIEIPDKKIIMG